MAFRLKAIEPKEADVQSAIMQALVFEQAQGRVCWFGRFNSGGMVVGKGKARRFVQFCSFYLRPGDKRTKGFPDIAGMLTDSRPLYLECKRPGGKVREEQAEFIERVQLYGAAAGIVDSVDGAIEIVRGAA